MDGRNHWSMDQPTARILWGLESQLKGLSHEATNSTHDLTSLGDVSDWTGCISEKKAVFFFVVVVGLGWTSFFFFFCCCCCCWMGGKRSIANATAIKVEALVKCANSCIDFITIQVWGRWLSRKHLHDIGRHTCFQHICPVRLQWVKTHALREIVTGSIKQDFVWSKIQHNKIWSNAVSMIKMSIWLVFTSVYATWDASWRITVLHLTEFRGDLGSIFLSQSFLLRCFIR